MGNRDREKKSHKGRRHRGTEAQRHREIRNAECGIKKWNVESEKLIAES